MKLLRWIRAATVAGTAGLLLAGVLLIGAGTARAAAPGQPAVPAEPEGNKACLECHSKPDQTMVRDGKEISVHVDGKTYSESVHGIIGCERCHAEVGPEHAKDPKKPLNLPTGRELAALKSEGCVKCHAGIYQESYEQSFHGIAVEHGDLRAATCVDCHGTHNILPARNAESMVAPANVAKTCSTSGCHDNAPANFAKGKEHFVAAKAETAGGIHWVYKFFMALLVFDTMKDGPIVMFELLRRLRS